MEGKSLVPGEMYLFRDGKHQIAVVFQGRVNKTVSRLGIMQLGVMRPGNRMLMFKRVDDGRIFYRRGAGSLSKHYDDCVLVSRTNACQCAARLQKEVK